MAFTSFSGPLRAGTQRDPGTTRNTGLVVLSQSVTLSYSVMTTAPTAQTAFVLPAGAKILRFVWETTTAISGGSVSAIAFSVGNSSSATAYQGSTSLSALTAIELSPATIAAAKNTVNCNNIGTSDVTLTVTVTATTGNPTAGAAVLTVEYVQRASDGSANPASA